jgi:hypothetical protein
LRITGAAARARGHSLYLMIFSLTLALRRARAALTKSFFNTKNVAARPLTHSLALSPSPRNNRASIISAARVPVGFAAHSYANQALRFECQHDGARSHRHRYTAEERGRVRFL